MTTYKKTSTSTPAKEVLRHAPLVGGVFVIYETASSVHATSAEAWESFPDCDRSEFEKSVAAAIKRKRRADDVREFGVDVGLNAMLVKVTPTQAVLERPDGYVRRYTRRTWRRVGSTKSLDRDVVRKIEAKIDGRDKVDFIAEGKVAKSRLDSDG